MKLNRIIGYFLMIIVLLVPFSIAADMQPMTSVSYNPSRDLVAHRGGLGKVAPINLATQSLTGSKAMNLLLSISNVAHEVTADDEVKITWTTDETALSSVYYWKPGNAPTESSKGLYVTSHSVTLYGIDSGYQYNYYVASINNSGSKVLDNNSGENYTFTLIDTIPPSDVTNLAVDNATSNTITLSWTAVTDRDMKHYLIYRGGSELTSTENTTFIDSTVNPSTQYSYQVAAVDMSGNIGNKTSAVTTTTLTPDYDAPNIEEIVISSSSNTSASFTITTDEASKIVFYYGTDQGNMSNSTIDTLNTQHSITISNLIGGDLVYYSITACDGSSNCQDSQLYSFKVGDDLSPPFVNCTIPEYSNSSTITLNGQTESYVSMQLYIDGQLKKVISRVDSTGEFTFSNVMLSEGEVNTINITAEDSTGNKATIQGNISVDTIAPVLSVSMDSTSTTSSLPIQISLTEIAQVVIFVQKQDSTDTAPGDVPNITLSYSSGSNTLTWDEVNETDIESYVVYRDGIGAIAEVTATSYSDTYINGNTTYKYTVVAKDEACNLGTISDYLAVATGSDIGTGNNASAITPSCGSNEPAKNISGSGIFNVSVTLYDGDNLVSIYAYDDAGNYDLYVGSVLYDSSDPVIEETNIDEDSPYYSSGVWSLFFAPKITVKGKTNKQTTVSIYINNDSSPVASVLTDSDGYFSTDIELRRDTDYYCDFSQKSASCSWSASAPNNIPGDAWLNNVKMVASDAVGRNDTKIYPVIYALCGGGGTYYSVTYTDPYPGMLNPAELILGYEMITFNANLTWVGGTLNEGSIKNVKAEIPPLSVSDLDKYDEDWINGGKPKAVGKNNVYVSIDLKAVDPYPGENKTKLEKERNISQNHIGDCNLPGFGCFRVPMMLEITFNSEDLDGNSSEKVQKTCTYVEVPIDSRLPSDQIPTEFLETTIGVINKTLEVIDKIMEPLKEVKKFFFWTCLGMNVPLIYSSIQEYWSCEFSAAVGGILDLGFDKRIAAQGMCEIYGDNSPYPKNRNTQGDESACNSCESAIKTRMDWESRRNMFCDKIFCAKVPTVSKYIKDATKAESVTNTWNKSLANPQSSSVEIYRRDDPSGTSELYNLEDLFKYSSHCETLEPTGTSTKININSKTLLDDYIKYADSCEEFQPFNKKCCGWEYMRDWNGGCGFMDFGMNELKEYHCHISRAGENDPQCSTAARLWNAVAGVCSSTEAAEFEYFNSGARWPPSAHEQRAALNGYEWTEEDQKLYNDLPATARNKDDTSKYNNYVDDNYMDDFRSYQTSQNKDVSGKTDEEIKKSSSDYSTWRNNRVTDLKYERSEIQTMVTGNSASNPPIILIRITPISDDRSIGVIGYRITKDSVPMSSQSEKVGATEDSLIGRTDVFRPLSNGRIDDPVYRDEDMDEWVKYAQDTFKTATGAKLSNNKAQELYNTLLTQDRDVLVDPTDGILHAFQCLCIPAMEGYLAWWRSMLTAVKACLMEIVITGDGKSGMCQAVLSVYVCDLLWDALKCIVNRMGHSLGSSGSIRGGFGGLMASVNSGMKSVYQSTMDRYGDSNTFGTLFSEEKIVHAFCLWAFTGDWTLDFEGFLNSNFSTPIKSYGAVYPCTRRFKGSGSNGYAIFSYHIGAGLVAGSEVNFRLYLQCSDTASCDSSLDANGNQVFPNGNCDCLLNGKGQQRQLVIQSKLNAGDVFDDEQYKVETQQFRYDKVVLEWDYMDSSNEKKVDSTECIISDVGGTPPVDCHWDVATLSYRCNYDIGTNGNANIQDVVLSGTPPFTVGDDLIFVADIYKLSPANIIAGNDNPDQTSVSTDDLVPAFLQMKIKNQNGAVVYDSGTEYYKISKDGTSQITIGGSQNTFSSYAGQLEKAWFYGQQTSGSTNVKTFTVSGTDMISIGSSYYNIYVKSGNLDIRHAVLLDKNGFNTYQEGALDIQSTGNTVQYTLKDGSAAIESGSVDWRNDYTFETQGFQITVTNTDILTKMLDDNKKYVLGFIAESQSTASTSTADCSSNEQQFTAEFTLYGASKIDPDSALNDRNAQADTTNKHDSADTAIKVVCNSQGVGSKTCAVNEYLPNQCKCEETYYDCGGDYSTTTAGIICVDLDGGKKCMTKTEAVPQCEISSTKTLDSHSFGAYGYNDMAGCYCGSDSEYTTHLKTSNCGYGNQQDYYCCYDINSKGFACTNTKTSCAPDNIVSDFMGHSTAPSQSSSSVSSDNKKCWAIYCYDGNGYCLDQDGCLSGDGKTTTDYGKIYGSSGTDNPPTASSWQTLSDACSGAGASEQKDKCGELVKAVAGQMNIDKTEAYNLMLAGSQGDPTPDGLLCSGLLQVCSSSSGLWQSYYNDYATSFGLSSSDNFASKIEDPLINSIIGLALYKDMREKVVSSYYSGMSISDPQIKSSLLMRSYAAYLAGGTSKFMKETAVQKCSDNNIFIYECPDNTNEKNLRYGQYKFLVYNSGYDTLPTGTQLTTLLQLEKQIYLTYYTTAPIKEIQEVGTGTNTDHKIVWS